MVGYHQTNQKTDTGKTLTRWPVLVDHNITAESGIAKGYICDLARPESVSQFSSQLLTSDKPIDILILNAAQWLSGSLDDQPDTEIINTVSSGLTGSILLTQALLPGLRRSDSADIISIISSCGVPNFTDSIAHPLFRQQTRSQRVYN
jgi:short-subunit dehydrogenase